MYTIETVAIWALNTGIMFRNGEKLHAVYENRGHDRLVVMIGSYKKCWNFLYRWNKEHKDFKHSIDSLYSIIEELEEEYGEEPDFPWPEVHLNWSWDE